MKFNFIVIGLLLLVGLIEECQSHPKIQNTNSTDNYEETTEVYTTENVNTEYSENSYLNEKRDQLVLAKQIIEKKYDYYIGDTIYVYTEMHSYYDIDKYQGELNSLEFRFEYEKRLDYHNLIQYLAEGMYSNSTTIELGDFIDLPNNLLSIKDLQLTDGQYLYLVSVYGVNEPYTECCYILSDHQLSYHAPLDGMIAEPMVLKCIGESTYKKGYSIQSCYLFKLTDPDNTEYLEFQNMLSSMALIKKSPNVYEYMLTE